MEGLGGGLLLGLGLALVMEMRDTSLRTERDIEFALRLPVLAMVPMIEPLSGKMIKQKEGGSLGANPGLSLGSRA